MSEIIVAKGWQHILKEAGDEARVRCAAHVDVVDALSWSPPSDVMFETEEEAMAYFLADFGDGIDFMQELQRAEKDGDDDTRH